MGNAEGSYRLGSLLEHLCRCGVSKILEAVGAVNLVRSGQNLGRISFLLFFGGSVILSNLEHGLGSYRGETFQRSDLQSV